MSMYTYITVILAHFDRTKKCKNFSSRKQIVKVRKKAVDDVVEANEKKPILTIPLPTYSIRCTYSKTCCFVFQICSLFQIKMEIESSHFSWQ